MNNNSGDGPGASLLISLAGALGKIEGKLDEFAKYLVRLSDCHDDLGSRVSNLETEVAQLKGSRTNNHNWLAYIIGLATIGVTLLGVFLK